MSPETFWSVGLISDSYTEKKCYTVPSDQCDVTGSGWEQEGRGHARTNRCEGKGEVRFLCLMRAGTLTARQGREGEDQGCGGWGRAGD